MALNTLIYLLVWTRAANISSHVFSSSDSTSANVLDMFIQYC